MSKSPLSRISEIRCEDCGCYVYPGEDFSVRTPTGYICYDSFLMRKERCKTSEYNPEEKLECVNCGIEIDVVLDGYLREATGFLWCKSCEQQRAAAMEE